ncbi:MAG: ABC transporter substrate-binding protein [Ktedonobacteraceae bacterium]
MHSIEVFCIDCGALNQAQGVSCFACGAPLPDDAAAANYIDPDQFIPGNLFKGRYRILSQVGSGGFGAVYKARDIQENDRPVAIKAIHLRGLKPREVIEATDTFNREVMMLSSLDHAHLPHVYDHFTDTEHWYLVMEFIGGETLEAYLSRAAVRNSTSLYGAPLQDVLNIGIQLCTVLDYLHTRHPPIVFRDIKPSNVLRMPDGHIYLIDFGIARHFKLGQARDTIVLGSPGYAAPEQYGKAQTTPRSDIYSLGALLHHLLTGSDPMDNPFHFAPLRASDASLSIELDALIEQMLSLDASERPASIGVVKETLQQIARRLQAKQRLAVYASYGANAAVHVASPPVPPASPARKRFVPARRMVQRAVLAAFTMLMIVGLCSFVLRLPLHPEPGPISYQHPDRQVYHMPVISATGDIATLDPALASDPQSLKVVAMLYTGLVGLNAKLQVTSELIASWSVSSDGLHWTFHLHPNLKFSDGMPLTSADVAYSINRALAPTIKSARNLTYLGMIKDAARFHAGRISTLIGDSITTPDLATVSIALTSPAQYFLSALAWPCSYVVEQSLITKYGKNFINHLDEGGGDGPFKVQSYTPGSGLTFVNNPNYYGRHAQLLRVVVPFYKSVEIAYQDYLAGRLKETPVPQADVSRDKGRGDFRQAPQLTTYYHAMNFLVKPFDNIHIRQAFALALNRDELAHAVWQDSVLPTNTLVPRGMEDYGSFLHGSDGIYSTLGDPTKAAMLLQQGMSEEGYSSLAQLPAITFTYHSTSQASGNEVTVDLLRWQRVLGVHVHADPVKNGDRFASEVSHSAHNSHGLQMWADSFTADYPDLHDVLTRQFDKNSPYNISNYGQNTSSDAAQQQDVQLQLEAADLNSNATTRLQAYQQAEQQLLNDVAWLPMFQVTGNVLIQPHVQGMVLGSLPFIFPDDWANVYIGTPPVG